MTVKERVYMSRLILQIRAAPEYAKEYGVEGCLISRTETENIQNLSVDNSTQES